MVPPAAHEALNLRLPEYSWAQGLLLALHSLLLAYANVTNCPSMPLAEAAEKLDSVRRAQSLTMIPASWYYLSNCRSLHAVEVQSPTAVSGWTQFVTGEPYVRNKNRILMGDSGSNIYSSNGKKHHSIAQDQRDIAGFANIHDLTEIGAHPLRLLELVRDWINRHVHYGSKAGQAWRRCLLRQRLCHHLARRPQWVADEPVVVYGHQLHDSIRTFNLPRV